MTMNFQQRYFILFIVVLTCMTMTPVVCAETGNKRPNILFIMSDDHAAHAIGAYDGRLASVSPTANLDRLAAEGVRLKNCFCTNSICTPSRATLMTGQFAHVNGVRTLSGHLDPARPNVAKLLQKAGYETAIVGKWHLKSEPAGFFDWCILPGQGKYFNPTFKLGGHYFDSLLDSADDKSGNTRVWEGHVTRIIGDRTLEWLARRSSDKPFFLMCHFKAPHDNFEYDPKYENLFDNVTIPEPPSLWEDRSRRSPATRPSHIGTSVSPRNHRRNYVKDMGGKNWPTGPLDFSGMTEKEKTRAAYQKYLKDYLRCVAGVDEQIGRIMTWLKEHDLDQNTVVIYTADQGMMLGEHDYIDKRWMYEESLQMPFIVRYPPEIPAGAVNDDLTMNVDFAPTFCDYAGIPIPRWMQGRSLRDNLRGRTLDDWRDACYYRYWMHMAHHDNPAHYGLRTRRYKLIFFYGLPLDAEDAVKKKTTPGWELFDLANDPLEMNNVYNDPAYEDVAERLKEKLLQIKEDIGDTDEKYPQLMDVRRQYWQ